MANLNVKPVNVNLSLITSVSSGPLHEGIAIKLSPLDEDGTVHDCTGITGGNLNFDKQSLSGASSYYNLALTIVAADATGVTVEVTPANVGTINAQATLRNNAISIDVTDGTDSFIAATGNMLLNFVP